MQENTQISLLEFVRNIKCKKLLETRTDYYYYKAKERNLTLKACRDGRIKISELECSERNLRKESRKKHFLLKILQQSK